MDGDCTLPGIGRNDTKSGAIRQFFGGRRTMDDGRWTMDGGRWTMDDGRWTMDDGRWTMDGGRWTMDDGRWTADDGRWTMDGGRWSMVYGPWSVVRRLWSNRLPHGLDFARQDLGLLVSVTHLLGMGQIVATMNEVLTGDGFDERAESHP